MSMANGQVADLGDSVATARDYSAAQKIVSSLIEGDVPPRNISIVGADVRTVERVTGRLAYAIAARNGAITGVLLGVLLWAIFVLGGPQASPLSFFGYLLVGVALGMAMNLTTFWVVRRRKDFASTMQVLAGAYEVRVLPESLAKARQIIGGGRTTAPTPPVDLDEPPQYGERVPPGVDPASLAQGTPATNPGQSAPAPVSPPAAGSAALPDPGEVSPQEPA